MRVAVSIWEDRISPVFDVSRKILILEMENGTLAGTIVERFTDDDPIHKLHRLRSLQVNTLICGAISRSVADMLIAGGIQTIPFVSGKQEDVIAAYLAGELPGVRFAMPGGHNGAS
jgi:predicted Fe-Mo cluster-binding NifX family protein